MSYKKILIASDSNELVELINNSKEYIQFFNHLRIETTDKLDIETNYNLRIFDFSDKNMNYARLKSAVTKENVIVCLDRQSKYMQKMVLVQPTAIILKPYNIHMIYYTISKAISEISRKSQGEVDDQDIDYLTKLLNRRGLYTFYNNYRQNKVIHLMYIDVDGFKMINDLYGHSVGDTLLIEIAHLIQKNTHSAATCRIGGDEYVVMLDGDVKESEVIDMAEKMLEAVSSIDIGKELFVTISLSIGIIMSQPTGSMLDDILYRCDAAMYEAKNSGKNKYVTYDSIREEFLLKQSIFVEKERALEEGQFEVYLQPTMNMATNVLYGAEALVRWNHPTDGVRLPKAFLESFEESGFIIKLDMYVFEQVCKYKQKWRGTNLEDIVVSVNASRLHLYQLDYVQKLINITNKYDIKPEEIHLEFQERVFDKDGKELIGIARRLREANFSVGIDDFGSGNAKFNMLKAAEIDTVKIDQQFLETFETDPNSRKVIRSIISMAKTLNLTLMAESIETEEQAKFLMSCGCELGQGELYASAMSSGQFAEYALNQKISKYKYHKFTFDKTLFDDAGTKEGMYISDKEVQYVDGVIEGTYALDLPGGDISKNCVRLTKIKLHDTEFTVSMWVKITESKEWASLFYAEYDTGFISIIPESWASTLIFRVRDERDLTGGWYDSGNKAYPFGEWVHIALTYNPRNEIMRMFLNAEQIGFRDSVAPMTGTRTVFIGGDVYQESLKGCISELNICNRALSASDIKKMYEEYTTNPGFRGNKKEEFEQ